ncbi:MAG: sigma-70 family RNA polymerase sigma factor [Phycisphaeraceae bacterium]|nr:sigma-70 family RNA polymerase sigma factor [Phycisphaeraceae bacterium]
MAAHADADRLLERALAGDREALVSLLESCAAVIRPGIERGINPSMRSLLDADDVMQVTFIEAVMRLDQFKGGGAQGFQAWLNRLAQNNLIDAVRGLEAARRPDPSRRVRGPAAAADSMVDLVDLLGANSMTPSVDAARGEAARHIETALTRLPRDYERVVRLYDLEGRTMAEVARELGRTEGASFMLRARAHERLRELMGSSGNFFTHAG